jgi:energy-coupling factor transporter transmembrane protein EcfT
MPQSQRRIVACLVVLLFLAIWVWGAATIGSMLVTAPKWLSLIFFIVAGIGWAVPLKPVFTWMNSGPER